MMMIKEKADFLRGGSTSISRGPRANQAAQYRHPVGLHRFVGFWGGFWRFLAILGWFCTVWHRSLHQIWLSLCQVGGSQSLAIFSGL